MKNLALVGLFSVSFCVALAQYPTRTDDHFWRRKVVNRIDLNEKINRPLKSKESEYYTDGQYADNKGLVMCLFDGLKAGKFVAYKPDSLSSELTYDDVLKKIREIEGSLEGGDFDDEGDGSTGFESFDGGSGAAGGDEWDSWDTGESGEGEDFKDDLSAAADSAGGGSSAGSGYGDFDPTPYENVIHFVENRIFDKVRSDMIYDIELIEIIWTDPGETLPEKKLCSFRYKDVMDELEQAQWKNRYNDAEYRSMREVFELRMFHSYIINVSGQGLRTLEEAEDRRQKLVEFEHHLWSY
ncbi:MAG: hypothetical protein SF053_07730 [Bacteroidia bacterium]|nr:hypothetical protein [Bacteroidia bacterium]